MAVPADARAGHRSAAVHPLSFALACFYSFVLGAGLFGSVYLLPLFLGIVRQHTPLEIGKIMIVGGVGPTRGRTDRRHRRKAASTRSC